MNIDIGIDIGIQTNIDIDIDLDLDFLEGKVLISILILKTSKTMFTTTSRYVKRLDVSTLQS